MLYDKPSIVQATWYYKHDVSSINRGFIIKIYSDRILCQNYKIYCDRILRQNYSILVYYSTTYG